MGAGCGNHTSPAHAHTRTRIITPQPGAAVAAPRTRTGITCQLARAQRGGDGIAVADLAAGRVHDEGATAHLADHGGIKQVLRLLVQRAVDGHHVTDAHHRLHAGMVGQVELSLHCRRQAVAVRVVQRHLKRLEATQYREADAAGRDRAHMHACARGRGGCCGALPRVCARAGTPHLPGHRRAVRRQRCSILQF